MKGITKRILLITVLVIITMASVLPVTFAYEATEDALIKKVKSTVQTGKISYTSMYDIDKVSKASLQKAGTEALKYGGKVFFNFDTLSGKNVAARVTVNPHLVKTGSGSFNFMLDISESAVKDVKAKFEKTLGKKVAVIKCNEQSYGMTVIIAAKLDLSGIDTSKLIAYSYNESTDEYKQITRANCYYDSKGYLYLQTSAAGYILITEK